jgi:bifunctional UDP-N-acetylglucosamine pyrophosphorylase/glucosamine-1-phosphate N-acetyltransferase
VSAGTPRIDEGVILTDVEVGERVELRPYCVGAESRVGDGCKIGPFAHLRPGTELGADVHIGNFVETKKARLGRGSKANHLAYVGDVIVGTDVNIGAGVIMVNYNGHEKRTSVVEDGAFIGSDSQLIAPVRVGRRAYVAAGSTIARDVPDGALALTRAPQIEKAGYADKLAARYADKKPRTPG